ncbi:MAG: hypothetical protein HZB65_00630 [Candidatus Aenigmarchaeota archaeon]|nr:hypothetical protein [Candidatus Aenigmarchaeota archaeon]
MRVEKHLEKLKEVLDEIQTALKDQRGVVSHQARLGSMLSLGIVTLIVFEAKKIIESKAGELL